MGLMKMAQIAPENANLLCEIAQHGHLWSG